MNRLVGTLLVAAAACFEYRCVLLPVLDNKKQMLATPLMNNLGKDGWRIAAATHTDDHIGDGGVWNILFERPIPCPTATPTARAPKP